MSSPYLPGIDDPRHWTTERIHSGSVELRTKAALRMDVLSVSSGYCIAVNGEVYAGSTVDDCVRHIVTALVAKGLET